MSYRNFGTIDHLPFQCAYIIVMNKIAAAVMNKITAAVMNKFTAAVMNLQSPAKLHFGLLLKLKTHKILRKWLNSTPRYTLLSDYCG